MTSPLTFRFSTQTQLDIGRVTRELADLQTQVSTGKKSLELVGYGEDAGRLISSISMQSTFQAQQDAIAELNARFDQQTAILNKAAQANYDLATAVRTAMSANDGRGLETELEIAFASMTTALNESFNGQPFFGGERYGQGPIMVRSTAELSVAAIPADVFDEAARHQTFDLGFAAPIRLADKASEISQDAFQAMRSLKLMMDAAGGRLPEGLSGAQLAELEVIARQLESAGSTLSKAEGRVGQLQRSLDLDAERIKTRSNFLAKSIGEQADADLSVVAVRLSALTTQYQAMAQSFSQISQLSLLNYLPIR
ncbi:MAG: flagellin [Hyphomonadaceae bacterium]|nr:flagellin [Hyphomonadaceae bacterium]